MENKQRILDLLLPALQETRNLYDLVELEYRADRELVYAKFASGNYKIVNVAMDSGTAMICDVVSSDRIKKSALISPARQRSTQKISQLYYKEKERISQMIKYSAVDLGDGTIRSEAQIEGDIKFLIVEFSRIAGCRIRLLELVRMQPCQKNCL